MVFQSEDPIRVRTSICSKVTEGASCLKHLCYCITYESERDISEKILSYSRAMRIKNQVLKPNFVRIYTGIRV
jgi:hypothetical protein